MKKFLIFLFILCFSLQVQAFEDIVLSTDGKITNIKIKDTSIININPLTTIQNERNILFITPLKTGETTFSLIKDDEKYDFNIKVEKNKTILNENDEFEILSLDIQPEILDCEIDLPPVLRKKEIINIDGATVEIDSNGEVIE